MPTLYYVPIIHSIEDYGALGPAIRNALILKNGKTKIDSFQKNINIFWKIIDKRIEKIIPDASDLIIYHDGFSIDNTEKNLSTLERALRNHPKSPSLQLIKKLLDKGASLKGMEDKNLVNEFLELYLRAIKAGSFNEQKKIMAANAARLREIMKLRDAFIVKRINDTLPENKKGILLLGRDHNVVSELEKLPRKFTIVHLWNMPL